MERDRQAAYEKMLEDAETAKEREYQAFLRRHPCGLPDDGILPPTREQFDAWQENPFLQ